MSRPEENVSPSVCERCDRAKCVSVVHDHQDATIPCEACRRARGIPCACDGEPVHWRARAKAAEARLAAQTVPADVAALVEEARDRIYQCARPDFDATFRAIAAVDALAAALDGMARGREEALTELEAIDAAMDFSGEPKRADRDVLQRVIDVLGDKSHTRGALRLAMATGRKIIEGMAWEVAAAKASASFYEEQWKLRGQYLDGVCEALDYGPGYEGLAIEAGSIREQLDDAHAALNGHATTGEPLARRIAEMLTRIADQGRENTNALCDRAEKAERERDAERARAVAAEERAEAALETIANWPGPMSPPAEVRNVALAALAVSRG